MKKLTVENLLSYKLTHPNGSLVDVARQYGVSKQYAHELWRKHSPNTDFNENWGKRIEQACEVCSKRYYVYKKLADKGHAKYCSRNCYFKNRQSLDF